MFIKKEIKNQVLSIQLHRPDKRNAFHPEMIQELTQAFEEAQQNLDLSAIILSGSGESFCAGADLSWMKSMINYSFEDNYKDSQCLLKMFHAVRNCDLPIIGRVHGHVMGGALGLISLCDWVAAENDTQFGFTEVLLGLVPAVISPFILEKANPSEVQSYLMSGEIFSSHQAHRLGLVQYIGTHSELEEAIFQKINLWSRSEKIAVRETKKLIRLIRNESPLSSRIEQQTCQVISERRASPEAQKRLRKFLEKK